LLFRKQDRTLHLECQDPSTSLRQDVNTSPDHDHNITQSRDDIVTSLLGPESDLLYTELVSALEVAFGVMSIQLLQWS